MGLDQISTGNVIGFLMEACEKKLVELGIRLKDGRRLSAGEGPYA
jgi:aldehyde:ferredoxin oxidoreductase